MNIKLSKAKEIALVVILILIAINLTVSYSYFSVNTTHDNTLSTISGHVNCLDITYEEQNSLNLSGQYPVSDEWALANMTPVTITVENNCENTDERLNYTLALSTLRNATGFINDNQIRMHLKRTMYGDTEKIFKNTDYVSSLNQLEPGNALDFITQDLQTRGITSSYTTITNYVLDSTDIGAGETNTYRLYLWIDYYEGDTTHTGLNDNTTQNKQYKTALSLVLNADENVEEGYQNAFDKLTTLASGVTKYAGKVSDTLDSVGTGVDATKVYAFTSNDNNNVVFANHCWQIRRTTETGGIKIQYNGEPALGTSNGKTTYDCGTTRAWHIGGIRSTLNLNGTKTYGTGYTTSVSGSSTTFTLTDTSSITVSGSNAASTIPTLNGKYVCGTGTATTCTNFDLKKIDVMSSGTTAYVYSSTYGDSLGNSVFNTPVSSISDVGYMLNTRYPINTISMSKSQSLSATSTYVIGDGISDNGDGTFSLTGTITEVLGSSWSSNYSNYVDKYVCMPGYWTNNSGTYICSDNGEYNVGALRYIKSTTSTNFLGTNVYKYGYGINASGNNYTLTAKSGNAQTLQFIPDFTSTTTSSCFTGSTKISSCGYKTLSNSHYTCYNLTGTCSTYYYINYSDSSNTYSISLTGGKYVSTDLADTNNVLYEMLNANNLNLSNSAIKDVVDLWYERNLFHTTYEQLIDRSAIFCNDRRIASYGGWNSNGGKTDTDYQLKHAEFNQTSNLYCVRALDAFNVENTSARLIYPIGLMSSPEMNLLTATVRKASSVYWLSTPVRFSNSLAGGRSVTAPGSFSNSITNESLGVRPAIVLNSNAEFSSGTGSTSDPFIVKGSEMTP